MRARYFPLLGLLVANAACTPADPVAGTPRTPAPAPSPPATVPLQADAPVHCPAAIDAAEVLVRHARAYGSVAAVASSLPRTVRMDVELEGKKGLSELVLDKAAHRWEELVGGVHQTTGIDATGAWMVGATGVPFRFRPDEATSVLADSWLARRMYLATFDAKRDLATCIEADANTPTSRVRVRYQLPEVGAPELELDLLTSALITASAAAADGKRTITRYETWSVPDANRVRWPVAMTAQDPSGNRTSYRVVESAPGSSCKGVGAAPLSTGNCLAMTTPSLQFEWPASGNVKVPMKHYLGEVSLRVRLADRETWALLDSGASITIVDATTPAGAEFVSSLELTGSGSSQKIRAGLGELPKLSMGALTLSHLPTASVPIPALDGYGDRRPEIIVGFSVFQSAAVRIDYAKSELVFARSAAALVKPGAPSVPIRVLDGKPVADVTVDDATGAFLLDTGNSGGIDMNKPWADAHGFPGQRPKTVLVARTGAGNDETAGTLFRFAKSKLGPITFDDRVAQIDNPPDPGIIAGLVGNEVFSRCAAVVFDLEKRALWLEPPCDRPRPEAKAGWRLMKRPSSTLPDRPWVIEKTTPTSAAAQAGFEVGDRLISVGGVMVGADVSKIEPVIEQREGTKVPVVIDRNGQRKQIVLVLARLLASPQ